MLQKNIKRPSHEQHFGPSLFFFFFFYLSEVTFDLNSRRFRWLPKSRTGTISATRTGSKSALRESPPLCLQVRRRYEGLWAAALLSVFSAAFLKTFCKKKKKNTMWHKVVHLHFYMCCVLLDVSSPPMFLPPLFNSLPRIPSLRPRYVSFPPGSVCGPVPTSVLLSLATFVYLVLSSP